MNPVSKLIHNFIQPPYIDKWTAVHMAAGAFICKVALWLGASSFHAVMWVLVIGLAWEIMEWFVEDGWRPYGSFSNYVKNTISDVVVETGLAIWIVI